MSGSVNKVILIGNLGADPELNHTKSGMAVTNISLATSSRVNGEDKTEWHRVTVWDKAAEAVAEYMKKGSKLYVEGRLQTSTYEDDSGETRYKTEVVANQVTFLDSKPKDEPATKKSAGGKRKGKPSEDDFGF